jgi:hypothetical protein
MADYYSLLSRAVGALPQSNPDSRHAVYERARKALFNQLRSIQPPVAETDISAEGRALDEAIARLELELARNSSRPERNQVAPSPVQPSPSPSNARSAGRAPSSPQPGVAPAQAAPPPPSGRSASRAPAGASFAGRAPFGKPARENLELAEAELPPPPSRDQQRPAAPLPPLPSPTSGSRRILAILAVLTVVAGLVGLAAWWFRERPEDLARLRPEDNASEPAPSGKLADRVGEEGDRDEAPATTAPRASVPAVPVAQKAELWVSAPSEANRVKTYPGTVVWRLDNIVAGPGQAASPAIHGDIDIPDAKMKMTLVFQKNFDAALSATHTVNVSFKIEPESDLKGIKAIFPIQMRRPEAQSGEKIIGIPVPITDNNFLIGLMRGDREARNLYLLRSPMILDLPMQLDDGRAATVSLEKGPAGERVFSDAIETWSRP